MSKTESQIAVISSEGDLKISRDSHWFYATFIQKSFGEEVINICEIGKDLKEAIENLFLYLYDLGYLKG